MEQKKSERNEDVIFDIIILLLILGIAGFLLTTSYTNFRRGDDISFVLKMYGSILLSLALSFAFKFTNTIKYFFWGSLTLYTTFLLWTTRKAISFSDDSISLVVVLEIVILFIYGMYYLIRKNKIKKCQ